MRYSADDEADVSAKKEKAREDARLSRALAHSFRPESLAPQAPERPRSPLELNGQDLAPLTE